jgi:hypothetical protein
MGSQVRDAIEEWLKGIKGVTCFTEKMKVYAPTCYGKCIDAVNELIYELNKMFGGSTVYDAEGYYVMNGREVKEPVKVIEIGHRCTDSETARKFGEAVAKYATRAEQSAIAIHQNDFYIAETPEMLESLKAIKTKLP